MLIPRSGDQLMCNKLLSCPGMGSISRKTYFKFKKILFFQFTYLLKISLYFASKYSRIGYFFGFQNVSSPVRKDVLVGYTDGSHGPRALMQI